MNIMIKESMTMKNEKTKRVPGEKKSFLDQLKQEHTQILAHLQAVKKQGIHTMEGRNALMAAKDLLCQHLKNEDEKLYPELKKAAKNSLKLKKMITEFIEDMKKATQFCQAFFKKYAISGGGIEFFRDFEKLYELLQNRIRKEEAILYPEYHELPM
jgi:hypothetical protein